MPLPLESHASQPGLSVGGVEIHPTVVPETRRQLWERIHQETVRHSFTRFLPEVRSLPDGAERYVFELRVGETRQEVAGASQPLRRWDRLPTPEVEALQRACEEHVARQNGRSGPQMAPDALHALRALLFPNPETNPELYRTYGPPWDRKLLILWGFDYPHAGVKPAEAAKYLRAQRSVEPQRVRIVWFGVLPALFALFLIGATFAGRIGWSAWSERAHRATLVAGEELVELSARLAGDARTMKKKAIDGPYIEVVTEVERLLDVGTTEWKEFQSRAEKVYADEKAAPRFGEKIREALKRAGADFADTRSELARQKTLWEEGQQSAAQKATLLEVRKLVEELKTLGKKLAEVSRQAVSDTSKATVTSLATENAKSYQDTNTMSETARAKMKELPKPDEPLSEELGSVDAKLREYERVVLGYKVRELAPVPK